MPEDEPSHIYLAFVPRSDTEKPSYWWSALRYMQAYRTMSQMELVAQRIHQRIKAVDWPWVRGLPDELHPGALTWETPPYAPVVTADDKREASFIASQTLHYLRSSLDHLVYNASWADRRAPQKGTQFPIVDERKKWSSKNGATKHLGGMSAQHNAIIESAQPFNGGQWTKDLQVLSNADKHRVGIEVSPTVQLHVHTGGAIADPNNPGVKLAQIEEISLRLLLPALHSQEFWDASSTPCSLEQQKLSTRSCESRV